MNWTRHLNSCHARVARLKYQWRRHRPGRPAVPPTLCRARRQECSRNTHNPQQSNNPVIQQPATSNQ